jgi:hypothetical protein
MKNDSTFPGILSRGFSRKKIAKTNLKVKTDDVTKSTAKIIPIVTKYPRETTMADADGNTSAP